MIFIYFLKLGSVHHRDLKEIISLENQLKLQPEGEIPRVTNWPLKLLFKKNHDDPSNIYCTPNKKITANEINYYYKNNFTIDSINNYNNRNNYFHSYNNNNIDNNIDNINDNDNGNSLNNVINNDYNDRLDHNHNNNYNNNNNDNNDNTYNDNTNDNNNNNNSNDNNDKNNNYVNKGDFNYLNTVVRINIGKENIETKGNTKTVNRNMRITKIKNTEIQNISSMITSVSTDVVRVGHLRGGGRDAGETNKNGTVYKNVINWVLESGNKNEKNFVLTENTAIYIDLVEK